MALQLDADVAASEETDEAIEQTADAMSRRVEHGTAGQRHEAGGVALELLERQRALRFATPSRSGLSLRAAHLHARHEPAQIAVALLRFDEDGQTPCWQASGFGIRDPIVRVQLFAIPSPELLSPDRQLGADDRLSPACFAAL